ncbi:hypothetical protein LQV05_003651 [Cryptococcus neoformans]|nr:hypothetical protein J007_02947 [Cryptococcus neoformans var. grubii]OXC61566.1 hypothetical protein C358_03027 [Cryptococcus neoformans var. grubii MW-RSA852]UOH80990.1 hypothetical protein LQV05_003651 [Cryptococcus neoformans]
MPVLQPRPLPSGGAAVASSKLTTTPLQKIERQYRKFLAKRYMTFMSRVALWIAVLLSLSSTVVSGDISKVPFAVLSSLPVILSLAFLLRVRKTFITQPHRPSPRTSFIGLVISSFWNQRVITLLFSYVVFSITIANVWFTLLGREDMALFNSTARHPWQLNESRFILIASNACLFLVATARDILDDRLKADWPRERRPFAQAVKIALFDNVWESSRIGFTFLWSISVPFAYCWLGLRSFVWQWVNWRLWGVALRPFLGSFARSTSKTPGPWALLGPMLTLNMLTLLALQFPVKGLTAYITQPFHFDEFYRKSPLSLETYLITALKSQDPYYLQFTLMELLRVVSIPRHRKIFFDDISKSPSLISQLCQELLLQFGKVHNVLINRGVTVEPQSTRSSPVAASVISTAHDERKIPVRQADIFRPLTKPKSTFNLKNILDGPIQATPPSSVVKLGQAGTLAMKHVESVQDRVVAQIEGNPFGGAIVNEAKGTRKGVNEWAGKEWGRRSVRSVLGDVLVAQRAIEILVILSVASIEEDTYGNVQQVLPAILEAIVRFREAIFALEVQLLAHTRLLGPAQSGAMDEVKKDLHIAIGSCDKAVRRIADTFGQSLSAFRFPPSVAYGLGEICKG